jgi:hypothetical protein
MVEDTMKIAFRWGIKTFSGYGDDMVYESCLNDKFCLGRDYTYPEITANNHKVGNIAKNLRFVYKGAATGYVSDLKKYSVRYAKAQQYRNPSKRHHRATAFAIFNKMMYAWYASDPTHVDLTTVTIADIVALDADVRSVARAVEAMFLPLIPDSSDLVNNIQ